MGSLLVQAPRWFQEGLAQRIESIRYRRNPFNMYEPEQFLALRLLDDAMVHSPDPQVVGQGYLVAHAVIRYLEDQWGTAGLSALMNAFASGQTTEEAIASVTGQLLPSFDKAFTTWGHARRDVFENFDLVTYVGEADGPVRRRSGG